MKIESKLLRAAKHCQAKDDVRFYLNGIHIYKNIVEATNGHVAVQMTMKKKIRGNFILNIKGAIPVKAKFTKFEFNKSETIAKHYDLFGSLISVSCVDVIVGKFPDVDKVIPTEFKPASMVGFNTEYVGLFSKMFGNANMGSAKFQFSGDMGCALLTSMNGVINEEFGNPKFLIMPTRL